MKKTKIDLIERAILARENSYSPYSNFSVGAAILADDGKIYAGSNVENASYGGGICAERSAATAAVSAGARKFLALAVVGAAREEAVPLGFAYPCGLCRQFINEFAVDQMPVYVAKNIKEVEEFTIEDLLPQAFGPKNLSR